jgi:hypothetical protein
LGTGRGLLPRAGHAGGPFAAAPPHFFHEGAEEEIERMVRSIKVPRARLSAVEGLIRFRFRVTPGAPSEFTELIFQAERTKETLELRDPETGMLLGLVTVFGQSAHPLGSTGLDEWVVDLEAKDKKAQATLAALPPGPPDPF